MKTSYMGGSSFYLIFDHRKYVRYRVSGIFVSKFNNIFMQLLSTESFMSFSNSFIREMTFSIVPRQAHANTVQ